MNMSHSLLLENYILYISLKLNFYLIFLKFNVSISSFEYNHAILQNTNLRKRFMFN